MKFLADCLPGERHEFAAVLDHQRCRGVKHLEEELARVEALGGEGLMLRQPASQYEVGRSSTLFKVKTFHDAEALVLDHQAGKGKHKGKLGALLVQLEDGTEFSVGTGFADAERAAPPPIGSYVTFRYQEFSDGGVPRFPSFVRANKGAGDAGARSSSTAKSATTKPVKAETSRKNAAASGTSRYFELTDGKSNKFWEISTRDTQVSTRYGRIGSDGTTTVKTFADAAAADKHDKHSQKLIDEKTGKGYVEQ